MVRYSVVVPVFNDAARFDRSAWFLAKWGAYRGVEVVVVNDGSFGWDRIFLVHICETYNFRLVHHAVNRGKWAAVRSGALLCKGSHLVIADADMSVAPWVTVAAYEEHCTPGDVMVGQRVVDEVKLERRVAGWFFNQCVKWVLRRKVFVNMRDSQCPGKVFPLGKVFVRGMREEGYAGDVEWILAYDLAGYRIRLVDVAYKNDSESKVRVLRDGFRMLKGLFRIRRRWL